MFHSPIVKVQVLLNHRSHWQVCTPLESKITWQSWHRADKVPHSYTAGIALCTSSTALDIPCTTEFSTSRLKTGNWVTGPLFSHNFGNIGNNIPFFLWIVYKNKIKTSTTPHPHITLLYIKITMGLWRDQHRLHFWHLPLHLHYTDWLAVKGHQSNFMQNNNMDTVG